MKKLYNKKYYENILLYVLIYILLFVVFLFNFYDTDDYSMQSVMLNKSIMDGLNFSIHYGNGRFIGNLGLYYFNYYPVIRMLFKPLVLTAMIVCCNYVFNVKSLWMRIVSSLLIIVPSSGFYAKCYSSNPCFMNYVAPVANVFFCFTLMKFIRKKKKGINAILYIVLFFSSVCMQFYSENSTIIFLVTAVFFIAYEYIAEKRVSLIKTIFLTGGIVGAVLMFIVPNHLSDRYIDKITMSEYRHIIINVPYSIGVVAKFAEYLSTAAVWIVLLGVILIYIVMKESLNDKFKFWHILFAAVYPIVCVIYKFIQTEESKVISGVKLFLMVLMCTFVLNSIIIIFRFIKKTKVKAYSVFMIFIFALSVGMFMILNQHGYRTFYLSLFIFVSLVLYLADYLIESYDLKMRTESLKLFNVSAIAVMLCIGIILPIQTIQNYDVFVMRQEYVNEKLEEDEKLIYVPKVPNKSLVRDEFLSFYKDYYTQGNKDVEIMFVDIEDWEKFEEYQSLMDNPLMSITYALSHLGYSNKVF